MPEVLLGKETGKMTCAERAAFVVEHRYLDVSLDVTLEAVRRARVLFCSNPNITDDEVVADLFETVNWIRDTYHLENQ